MKIFTVSDERLSIKRFFASFGEHFMKILL